MNIGSICTRHIVTIDRASPLQQAAALMREHHVGALVVTESRSEGLQAVGIVTDRDLAIEVLARGGDAARVEVGALATAPLVSALEDFELGEAIGMMQSAGVRRLLVRNAEDRLVGLVSFDDLLPACIAPLAGLAEVLRKGMAREVAERGAALATTRPPVRVPAIGTAGWQANG